MMRTATNPIDVFTDDDLQVLLAEREGPCVSLYMPTERKGPETEQNPIRFKNLITEARKAITDYGADLSLLDPLLESPPDWQHMSEGLAVFIAPDLMLTYRLPAHFDQPVHVGRHFNIRPLLPLVGNGEQFFILALDQSQVRVLRGTRYHVGEVELDTMPQSLADILRYDEYQRHLQAYSTSRYTTSSHARGDQDAMFHGQGTAADDSVLKDQVTRLFEQVDNGIVELLAGSHRPLVLAGVDYMRGLYRQANHYDGLMADDIDLHPQSMGDEDLHRRAWDLVEPRFRKPYEDALAQYEQLASGERTTTDIEQIVLAAAYKRVDTLFIPVKGQHWGRLDANQVEIHASFERGDQELLNTAAIHTLKNGGTVFADERSEPAAVLRY